MHRQVQARAHAAAQNDFGFDIARPVDDGGQIALPGKVQLLVDQRLVHRRACAFEERPLDLHAVFLEFFFQHAIGVGQRRRGAAVAHRVAAHAARGHADADDFQRLWRLCLCGRHGAQ